VIEVAASLTNDILAIHDSGSIGSTTTSASLCAQLPGRPPIDFQGVPLTDARFCHRRTFLLIRYLSQTRALVTGARSSRGLICPPSICRSRPTRAPLVHVSCPRWSSPERVPLHRTLVRSSAQPSARSPRRISIPSWCSPPILVTNSALPFVVYLVSVSE
jgi:hypothetical protein